jgi:hypothetical protein
MRGTNRLMHFDDLDLDLPDERCNRCYRFHDYESRCDGSSVDDFDDDEGDDLYEGNAGGGAP